MEKTQNNFESIQNNLDSSNVYWIVLLVVIIGTFMSTLDSSIVNIAVPTLMSVFGTNLDTAKWIITGYSITLGAIIPLTGFLSDVFGEKIVYIFSLFIFTVGSLLCGLATTVDQMIAFRIIQAIGGGMIIPVGMTMLMRRFPKEKLAIGLGLWGVAMMSAPAIGPTIGGAIIQYLDWRIIFTLNIPIGVCGMLIAIIFLPGDGKFKMKKFDAIGFVTSAFAIASVLYVLGEDSTIHWDKIRNPILLLLSVGCFAIFVINELGISEPLLNLRVFKIPAFTMSQILVSAISVILFGGIYLIPLFLQSVRGYTSMESGLIMLPAAIVMAFLMAISGKFYTMFGIRKIAIPGVLVLVFASYKFALALNLNTTANMLIFYTCLRSVGLGLTMMTVNTYGLGDIADELSSSASAVSNTIKQIVGAISVTYVTSTITNNANANYADVAEKITPYTYSGAHLNSISSMARLVTQQATILAMSQAAAGLLFMAIISLAISLFLKENPVQVGEENKVRVFIGE